MAAAGKTTGGETLGRRALNRATLDRQMLLQRASDVSVRDAVEHLVGLQAQAPMSPYYGLWSRLAGFVPDDLARLLVERTLVRMVVMRGTIHLVSAADCLVMRPLIQPILDRDRRALDKVAPELADLDLSELGEVAHARFEDEPLSFTELAPWLAQRWPDQDPETLIRVVRDTMALVQVPPRGIWGKSGPPRLTTVEAWLGRSVEPRPSIDALVLRYLGAFGPASVGDVQTWSGLTRLGEVVDRLRPRLRIIRDENGRELFDLPDVARTDPDTPAPPRFLPDFDNLLRSHDDRTRVLSDEHRRRIATKNGMAPNGLLVDGFLAGTWKVERPKGSTRAGAGLAISLFHRLCQADLTEVEDEGQRLLAFAAADADADQRIVRVSHLG